MKTSLTTIARRAALTASRKAPPCVTFAKCFSGKSEGKLPDEEYYHGHLVADHLEYLDDMIDKTIKIEESVEGLKDTYAKKKDVYNNVGFTTSADLDALFDTAAVQKDELSQQLEELREALRKQRSFAVDAPDGTSDAMRAENRKQVDQIINYAASHEDKEAILEEHKRKIQGVDAPDGTSDAMRAENLKAADETIGYAATHKEEILQEKRAKQVGVDAPDGTSEAMEAENRKQVDEIIDYAADHEDKDKIEYEHKMEDAVRKERARDPEHDW